MWVEHNENPNGKKVGDCVIRALSFVLDQEWERTFIEICLQGFIMGDMPSANSVWGAYLKGKGYRRGAISDECHECYSVIDFCRDFPNGKYILALSSHVVAVSDGDYYDTWDSGDETPIYYWYLEDK